MSTAPTLDTIDIQGTQPVPFSRLVRVEWRKMLDTRSGKWLLGITLGLLVLVAGIVMIVIATSDEAISYKNWLLDILIFPLSVLLPVFAILSVTSEWSQRTGLGTFTLESNRTRLTLAKLTAVSILALGTLVVAAVVGAVANLIGSVLGGYDASWSVPADKLAWALLVQVLYFLMAFGLGALILSSAAAVTVFYVFAMLLPFMIYFGLTSSFEWASNIIPFFDLQTSSAQVIAGKKLYNPDFGSGTPIGTQQYLQFAVAVVLWVVTPLTIGFGRIRRTEVK